MLLAIDIGNSNITIGAYRGNELLFLTRMGTDRTKMPDEYAIAIHSLLRLYGYHGSDYFLGGSSPFRLFKAGYYSY